MKELLEDYKRRFQTSETEDNIAYVIYNTKTKTFLDKSEFFTDKIKNARIFTNEFDAKRSMNYYVRIYGQSDRKGTCDNLVVLPVEMLILIKK